MPQKTSKRPKKKSKAKVKTKVKLKLNTEKFKLFKQRCKSVFKICLLITIAFSIFASQKQHLLFIVRTFVLGYLGTGIIILLPVCILELTRGVSILINDNNTVQRTLARYKKVLILYTTLVYLACAVVYQSWVMQSDKSFVLALKNAFYRGLAFKGMGVLGGLIAYPLVKLLGVLGSLATLSFITVIINYPLIRRFISTRVQKSFKKKGHKKEYDRELQNNVQHKTAKSFYNIIVEKEDVTLESHSANTVTPANSKPTISSDKNSDCSATSKSTKTSVTTLNKQELLKTFKTPSHDKKTDKIKKVETQSKLTVEDKKHNRTSRKSKTSGSGKITHGIYLPIELLETNTQSTQPAVEELQMCKQKLEETFKNFGIDAQVTSINVGPVLTQYEVVPSKGVKVSRITSLENDIALVLATPSVRMEVPIPGKSAIGIEVPNKTPATVFIRDLFESPEFINSRYTIPFAVGKDVVGNTIICDITKLPHLLIAGATGTGKSVCLNTLIVSILYKCQPEDVKLILIDPKMVELSMYNGIPHLLIPVVTDTKKATNTLLWAVEEMMTRYNLFAQAGVRDITGYNNWCEKSSKQKLPYIVIVIDELADLMMVSPAEVEDSICRLAQMARAAGIHLVLATQRPSVDVITGIIKANIPSRIAFAVSSQADSRTILDQAGAEKLLGRGDMLFYPVGAQKPARVQGAFISESEVEKIVEYLKNKYESNYDQTVLDRITTVNSSHTTSDQLDELFDYAVQIVVEQQTVSTSLLQRKLKIGYSRAARLIDQMEEKGIVSKADSRGRRKVLVSKLPSASDEKSPN